MVLPMVFFVLALLVQPACVLYTRTVMQGAAAEGVRALGTAYGKAATEDAVRDFVLRRLKALPELELFHVGGDDGWEIELTGGSGEQTACVSITGRSRLLPLAAGMADAFGAAEGRELSMTVSVQEQVRPDWLEGGYGDWVRMWDVP